MSLKNLVSKVKKIQTVNAPSTGGGAVNSGSGLRAFGALDYNLNLITPDTEALKSTLQGFLDSMETTKGKLSDKDKKRLLLMAFRLAYSQDERATGCFHPSEISQEERMCRRKMYFQKGRVAKDATYVNFTSDNRMMRLVDLGTLLHLYVQENLDRLGVLIDFEVAIQSPEHGVSGSMDGAIHFAGEDDWNKFYDEDMALEIKSINDNGFRNLRGPKPEHVRQASIYGSFLGYKNVCYIYYNKNNSELKIYAVAVDTQYVEDFKELAKGVIQEFTMESRKQRTQNVSKHKTIPAKICSNRTTGRAMECAFADYCFKHKSQ